MPVFIEALSCFHFSRLSFITSYDFLFLGLLSYEPDAGFKCPKHYQSKNNDKLKLSMVPMNSLYQKGDDCNLFNEPTALSIQFLNKIKK
jgi:hypothetical protein